MLYIKCSKCNDDGRTPKVCRCDELSESTFIDLLSAERVKFEKWVQGQGFHISKAIHRDYENSKLNWMWKSWQAAISR